MADKGHFKVVVLWEEEIRIAAAALRALLDEVGKGDGQFDKDKAAALRDRAFEATLAALWGADEEDSALTLTRQPVPPDRKRGRWFVHSEPDADEPDKQ